MLVPEWRLPEGRWDLTISWETSGKEYLQKERLSFMKREHLPGSAKTLKR